MIPCSTAARRFRFARVRRRAAPPSRSLRIPTLLVAAVLAAPLLLAGCATGGASPGDSGGPGDPAAAAQGADPVRAVSDTAAAAGVGPDSLGLWRLGNPLASCPGSPQMWSLQRTQPSRLECWYDYRRSQQADVLGARPLALKLEAVAGRLVRVSYTLAGREDPSAIPATTATVAPGTIQTRIRSLRMGAAGQPGAPLLPRLSEAWGPSPRQFNGPAGILEAYQWQLPAGRSARYQPIAGTVDLVEPTSPDPVVSAVVDPYRPDPDPATRNDLAVTAPAGTVVGLQIAGYALGQRLDACPPQAWSVHEIRYPRAQRICLLSLDLADRLPVRNLVLNILGDQLAEMTLGPRQTSPQSPAATTRQSLDRLSTLLGPPSPRQHGTWLTWELGKVEGKDGQEVVAFDQGNGTLTVGRRLPPLRTTTARNSVTKTQ